MLVFTPMGLVLYNMAWTFRWMLLALSHRVRFLCTACPRHYSKSVKLRAPNSTCARGEIGEIWWDRTFSHLERLGILFCTKTQKKANQNLLFLNQKIYKQRKNLHRQSSLTCVKESVEGIQRKQRKSRDPSYKSRTLYFHLDQKTKRKTYWMNEWVSEWVRGLF